MSLEKVVETLLSEAKAEFQKTLEEAEKEASRILSAAREEAARILEEQRRAASLEAEALQRRERSSSDLEARRIVLLAEKELHRALREAARKRLSDLPSERRIEHVRILSQRGGPHFRLLVSERDLEGASKSNLKVSGAIGGIGGCILESEDGSVREDLTYESLLEEAWVKALPEVARILRRG